ncbi:MAG: MBL fold metallo-hydrolase [Candidatus Bathyarchaeota archaeon]|nr:MBL fold metallo-hydrolase [Candidatus Termiticorpusculum sp.]
MVKKSSLLAILLVIVALIAGVVLINGSSPVSLFPAESPVASPSLTNLPTPIATADPVLPDDSVLQVIFLDVGQADSILLKTGDHAMLIDAGNLGQDKLMLDYLAEYGVTKLDYLVATHPHSDHIGAMPAVVRAMESIGEVIMPDKPHTTTVYKNLIKAIDEKNIPLNIASVDQVFNMGNANIQIIAPGNTDYTDLNEVSVVLRVTFGETVFLFTGDAGTKSENAQLTSGLSLKADVLKVGHHGSRTSTIQKYLDAVSPRYAVISCGTDNPYGHPHSETMARLNGKGITIYRTDKMGTIIFVSDGKNITIEENPNHDHPITPSSPIEETASYVGNKNSKTFHLSTCSSLPAEQNRVYFDSYQDAIDAGYKPCGVCKP